MEKDGNVIAQDEASLRTLLSHFCCFDYDRTKELADKEKEARKSSGSPSWLALLNCISQLAMLEKLYMDLDFLLPRGFLRKESSVRVNYETLLTELAEIEKKSLRNNSKTDNFSYAHITTHLVLFIQARLLLLTFYEKVASFPANKNSVHDELIMHIDEIILKNQPFFTDSLNTPIRQLLELLHSLKSMQEYDFLNSLIHLNEANDKMQSWLSMVQSRETRKYSFGSGFLRSSSQPSLYRWLIRAKSAFVAKYSLYFWQPLSEQTSLMEMKNISSKLSCDYISKIQNFHRKTDAHSICVVLDAQGLESYKGKGYKHPSTPAPDLTGFELFPHTYCYPMKPSKYWHCVAMRASDRSLDEGDVDKVMYFYDDKNNLTFFVCRIEPRYTMVVIFENKKSERDAYVREFLLEMASSLRHTKIFSGMRQR